MGVRKTVAGFLISVALSTLLVLSVSTGDRPAQAQAGPRHMELVSGLSDADPLPDLGAAPEFRGIETWLNSRPLDLASLRGKVLLVEFWTLGCINCLHALPYVSEWQDKYADRGLVVIGIHSPELPSHHDRTKLAAAVAEYGIRYPVAADNRLETWKAYRNRYWPAFYFIDARGHVRHAHFGAGNYANNEAIIRRLLAERSHDAGKDTPSGSTAQRLNPLLRSTSAAEAPSPASKATRQG